MTDFNKNQRLCDQPDDLSKYVAIYADAPVKEMEDFGCLEDLCNKIIWDRMWTDVSYRKEKHANVRLHFQSNIPTKVTSQTFSYDFTNFIADFGGYLGLLLGASMLSIFDSVWSFAEVFVQKQKPKKQKKNFKNKH